MTVSIKPVRHIMPFGPRVLVRVIHEEDVASSGLYLPAGAKEKMQESLYGEILEVARAEPKDPSEEGFGVNVAGVPNGARVLFAKGAGIKVPWDEELRILETKEVLATVEEIPEDEIL
ncbi:MAG: co-chaperone GroES [Deltaproteobacteria bacterium]|nr:co-chaperone GroES [Deltaproteobacteria bacterium]